VQDFFEHPQHSAALKFDEVMLGHIKLWRNDHAFPACGSDDPIADR